MKNTLLLILSFFFATVAFSQQWVQQPPATTSFMLLSTDFTHSDTGVACGTGGDVLRTVDGGLNWNLMNTPIWSGLSDIKYASSNVLYAVGELGKGIKSTDGGITWNSMNIGTFDQISAVYFTDANTGFFCGSNGMIGKTTDGGANWNIQNLIIEDFRDIQFTTSLTGYVVGRGGYIYRTVDAGGSWSPVVSGTSDHLYAVSFPTVNTGYASGLNGKMIKTTDGGNSWFPLNSGTNEHLWDVYFLDGNEGYVVGDNLTILHTTDGGTTWALENYSTQYSIAGITFANGVGYCVGHYGLILKKACSSTISNFTFSSNGLDASFNNSYGTSYSWDFGDGNFSSFQQPNHTYANPGTYTVCLYLTSHCGIDTICHSVTVNTCANPIAGFDFIDNGDGTILFNDTSTTAGGSTYWWDFGEGNFSSLASPTSYFLNGVHSVCLTVSDSCGSDMICHNIFIAVNVSVNEQSNNQNVTVFPNPFSDHAVIQIENGKGNYAVELYDITGRMVTSENYKNTSSLTINRKSLNAGTYLFRIVQNNSTVASGKLMVVN